MLASEASALFSELPPLYTMPEYPTPHPNSPFFESFVPFELVFLWAVLPIYLRGDQHLVLQHLQEISYGCKLEYRRSGDTIWISRLRCTAIAIANVLYSMGELQHSLALLQMLSKREEGSQLLPAVCMLALEMGDIASADAAVTNMKETEGLATQAQALEIAKLLCEGQWVAAEEAARNNAEISETSARSKINLAVCCLYTAKTQEVSRPCLTGSSNLAVKVYYQGIEILESIARTDPSFFYNSETHLSNLISLQELQAGDQIANKLDLLKECSRYSSEALSLDCLRL